MAKSDSPQRNEQRLRDDEREWNLQGKACATAFFCFDLYLAIELLDIPRERRLVLPATGKFSLAFRRGEARVEQELEQIALADLGIRRQQPTLDRGLADALIIDPLAVVLDLYIDMLPR